MAERMQVLNADVFVIDGRHIRLADAVAPQPIPDARCWAEALAAKQATLAARELVRTSRKLRVEPTGKTDEYGRAIAHVFLDNQDLATLMHDAGFVADAQPGRFSWCAPLSAGGEGGPDFRALMDFSHG
jgi:endonuclease YncB( thermonuclease family)